MVKPAAAPKAAKSATAPATAPIQRNKSPLKALPAPIPRKRRRKPATPPAKRALIHRHGIRVYEPTGKNKDGTWSKRHKLVAVFLRVTDARAFMAQRRAAGAPAYTVERG
jgi:hypothetical protein